MDIKDVYMMTKHDYANQLQLIHIYTATRQYEKLEIYVNMLATGLKEEQLLLRLPIPLTIHEYIEWRLNHRAVKWSFEVDDVSSAIRSYDQALLSFMSTIFIDFEKRIHDESLIQISLMELNDSFKMIMTLSGDINHIQPDNRYESFSDEGIIEYEFECNKIYPI